VGGIQIEKKVTVGSLINLAVFGLGIVWAMGQRSADIQEMTHNHESSVKRIEVLEETTKTLQLDDRETKTKFDYISKSLDEIKAALLLKRQ
jgi:hypothetical protein